MSKMFGTDGIRGRVGTPPITADRMLHIGWALGRALADEGPGAVLIGKDTRISGYMFESALEAGLSAAGMDILLSGPMPTPAIAYLTRTLQARAGIVISASHNPYHDNGVKIFSTEGLKLSDETQQRIEALMQAPFTTVNAAELGKASRIDDAPGRYIEYCKSRVADGLSLRGLRMVVDCANGATYQVGPRVFMELGAEVHALCVEPDGFNINEGCGSTDLARLRQAVVDEQADIGIAFDGDGDRVMLVDHQGQVVDGDGMLYILAMAWHKTRPFGGVAGTLMSNLALEQALAAAGIPFIRTPVGDRHVHRALREKGWTLGGEPSGHILCLDRTVTGDGIVSALQVLEIMVSTGRSLAELAAGLERYPQVMINVPVSGSVDLDHNPTLQQALERHRADMAGQGRVVLRASGTEPKVRVMVEHQQAEAAQAHAEALAAIVQAEFGEQIA